MGGSIGVVARFADGSVCATAEGWTNPLPYRVQSLAIDPNDESVVRKYVEYYEATADAPIAPSGYGLVVFDFTTKTLLHCQGYSQMTAVLQFYQGLKDSKFGYDEEQRERVEQLHDRGKLVLRGEQFDPAFRTKTVLFNQSSQDAESLDAFLMEAARRVYPTQHGLEHEDRMVFTVVANIEPWTVERFAESEDGFTALKARLIELGFAITPDADKAWTEFCDDRFREE